VSARIRFYGADELVKRLRQLDARLRQKTLREIGRDVGKVVLPVMKSVTRRRTGGLIKSYGHKSKIYKRGILSVIVGPRTKAVFATKKGEKRRRLKNNEFFRDPKNRQWRWKKEEGTKYYRPSKIAHLAGPGRKSLVLQRTISQVRRPMQAVIERHFKALAESPVHA
jgi:hypothetical protein